MWQTGYKLLSVCNDRYYSSDERVWEIEYFKDQTIFAERNTPIFVHRVFPAWRDSYYFKMWEVQYIPYCVEAGNLPPLYSDHNNYERYWNNLRAHAQEYQVQHYIIRLAHCIRFVKEFSHEQNR